MEVSIDDSLYSRQRYVLGDRAMSQMAHSSIFLSGLGGLGVEIAKNIVLAGIKTLTIHDTVPATMLDLCSQFFLREEDVTMGRNRAEASLSRVAELNPYVTVTASSQPLDTTSDLSFLKAYQLKLARVANKEGKMLQNHNDQCMTVVMVITTVKGLPIADLAGLQCVVLTDAPLALQLKVNQFCRAQNPPIRAGVFDFCTIFSLKLSKYGHDLWPLLTQFISCSLRGVFSAVFCDFGPEFLVLDNNGEEPAECFIGNISKANPGVVTCLEGYLHGLESGDQVTFTEVAGMNAINGTTHVVKVVSPSQFTIGDTSGEMLLPYQHGGIARQIKLPTKITFEPLEKQLRSPTSLLVDFAKLERPLQAHLCFIAVDHFLAVRSMLPKPRDAADAELLLQISKQVNEKYKLVECVDATVLSQFASTAQGLLPPLATAMGGVVAQEALIALTGKFSPLRQWLYLDATELLRGQESANPQTFLPCGDRYDSVRICLGENVLKKLADLKLFMVGCGAIGCEMLKNFAMLGVGRVPNGLLTITDNDIIEKSNLNRQFLFRSQHIQKPKSVVAAQSAMDINPDLRIEAHEYKVFPGTEQNTYNDAFFQAQNIVVNALDNVEARRYVDSRCVTNQRALLESGTMGAKGHVQVIIPHQTECYSSQQDPPEKDVPYCTLKSFPATVEHTIQWARDKFENLFTQKPSMYNKFWSHDSPQHALEQLQRGSVPNGLVKVVKMLHSRPFNWSSCVQIARTKFEKYFNHKALSLLNAFPLDTKMKDGSLFWQSARRSPTPLQFDPANAVHMSFVVSLAQLYACIYGIHFTPKDLSADVLSSVISSVQIPEFRASSKPIETDVNARKPEEVDVTTDDLEICQAQLEATVANGPTPKEVLRMFPVTFEKDDDSNGHIDFITAASNLRASMYSIENVDRFKTKLIAGRIVPAIATTTAAVAGLVSIELIKVVLGQPIECYKNAFLNLALPAIVFSEPAVATKTTIRAQSFTLWDRWEVRGSRDFKLQDFLKSVENSYGLVPAMVVHGVKMVYVPMMPGHGKRLPQTMLKLLKPGATQQYVDLTVSFENEQEDDVLGPPIRYYF